VSDWSEGLRAALESGDADRMHASLANLPSQVMIAAVPLLAERGQQCVAAGDFAQSLVYLTQLVEIAPDSVEWLQRRARVYLHLGRPALALSDAKRIVEVQSESPLGLELMALAYEQLGEKIRALTTYRRMIGQEAADEELRSRIATLERQLLQEALTKTPDPDAPTKPSRASPPSVPSVAFDPTSIGRIPTSSSGNTAMIDGLNRHLRRYSDLQAVGNTLSRIEDPLWMSTWDSALRSTKDQNVLFVGSELGVLALRAQSYGARRTVVVEESVQASRISSGMIQKNLLIRWHAEHSHLLASSSEDERRASFEDYVKGANLFLQDDRDASVSFARLIFANLDHSLLGTGIVKAIRKHRSQCAPDAQTVPRKAKIFAQAIQWTYPNSAFQLQQLNQLRWSLFPQPLDLPADAWVALTEVVNAGEIDFANFSEAVWPMSLPIHSSGDMDAILFWFELDLGAVILSNSPYSGLRCIKPAVQYCDSSKLIAGERLTLTVHLSETLLRFKAEPPTLKKRTDWLPSWYLLMVLDAERNAAYEAGIRRALDTDGEKTVLDIGTGCGLLAMMAAQAGADRVFACEKSPSIYRVGNQIIAANGLDRLVTMINKDVRSLCIPADMPERANIAVFELFDCSLIGEGVLHFLSYARSHLLQKEAKYVPKAAKVRAVIIERRVQNLWEMDLNLLNPFCFSSDFINVDAKHLQYRALCEPFDVFSFDFSEATAEPHEFSSRVKSVGRGIAGAVLFWFDLQIDEHRWISNSPASASTLHWKQALQFLPEIHVDENSQLPISASHDGSHLSFRWTAGEVPKEAFSKLPRVDPSWLREVTELDAESRGLLQHCLDHPSEYLRVAEVAQCFGVDPAAYGLDPKIAQRFASIFFQR